MCGVRQPAHGARLAALGVANEAELLDAINQAWTKIRAHEKTSATKDDVAALQRQMESRIWHRIVVAVAVAEFSLIVMLLEKFAK